MVLTTGVSFKSLHICDSPTLISVIGRWHQKLLLRLETVRRQDPLVLPRASSSYCASNIFSNCDKTPHQKPKEGSVHLGSKFNGGLVHASRECMARGTQYRGPHYVSNHEAEKDACWSPAYFLTFFTVEHQPKAWWCPNSGWVFCLQLNISGNTFITMCFHRDWFKMHLIMKVIHYNYWKGMRDFSGA